MADIKKLQEYFEKFTWIMIKEGNYPGIFKEIFKYGIKNVFLVSTQYDFNVFYNNKTGKFIKEYRDETTNLPNGFEYEDMIYIGDAILEKIINENKVVDVTKSFEIQTIESLDKLNVHFMDLQYNDCFPFKVQVKRGRKFKGEGYIIKAYARASMYGPDTYIAEIYNPENNTINECTLSYVDFLDNVLEDYKKWAIEKIKNASINDIIYYKYDDFKFKKEFIATYSIFSYINETLKNKNLDYSNATNVEEEKRKAKQNSFKENKMKDLIEWVKKNTDKEGDDIQILAERIWKKRYE